MRQKTETPLRSVVIALTIALAGCAQQPVVPQAAPVAAPEVRLEQANPNTVAERHIALAGDDNFRDLGGFVTGDGRRVKWGALYRSGHWGQLTEADQKTIQSLGIRRVIDFRSADEVKTAPDRVPAGIARDHWPILGGDINVRALLEAVNAGQPEKVDRDLLISANQTFVRDYSPTFGRLLKELANGDGAPLAFHCTAGKDRTGLAAALFLLAVGVPQEAVMADYLESNRYRAALNARTLSRIRSTAAKTVGDERAKTLDLSPIEALLAVKPEYLNAAFAAIQAKYGNPDTYFRKGLGLTDAELVALKARYTE